MVRPPCNSAQRLQLAGASTMQVERVYEDPTKPFHPVPVETFDWRPEECEGLELDADLLPAFAFLERNPDALRFVGPAMLEDADLLVGILRHAPVLDSLPTFVVHALRRRSDVRFVTRISRFTPAQRREIANALIALEASYEGSSRQHAVTVALDSYWRSLVENS